MCLCVCKYNLYYGLEHAGYFFKKVQSRLQEVMKRLR